MMETPPVQNHVLVDFENVHQIDPEIIGDRTATFTLLLGAKQKRLDVALVERFLEHSSSVRLVRLSSSGRNALDFALAYYLGQAVAADPAGTFHIIARDKGYDPLVAHLRTRNVQIHRHEDFSALTFGCARQPKVGDDSSGLRQKSAPTKGRVKGQPVITAKEGARQFRDHLISHPNNRPKRGATLLRHITNHFGKELEDGMAESVIKSLKDGGQIAITTKDRVSYNL
jgi:hypothetical protein